MAPKPIDPHKDSRVTHKSAVLNGRKYHYVHGLPKNKEFKATVLCIHGFPDLWYSWRFIIPALLDMGLQVIVPDMIGYGQTDMPKVPPNTLAGYGWKASSDDMAELLKQLNIPRVILLGHDWGGAIVQRIYYYHPEVVTHIASFCTPYFPPQTEYIPIEDVVKRYPTFTYQIAFNDPQTEKDIRSKAEVDKFFRGIHRGMDDTFTGEIQVRTDFMKHLGDQPRSKLLTKKDLDYYVQQYLRNGIHGPLNWYKTRMQNHLDEKNREKSTVDVPYLYVGATHDVATPPSMATNQGAYIPNLTTRVIESSHWVLVEAPDNLIGILNEWFNGVCFGTQSKL